MKHIRLAYIGGGSRAWARVFMNDLALTPDLSGEIALYDIDRPAAEQNLRIGDRINALPETRSQWRYLICDTLEEALAGADFVICSILPGRMELMEADVHLPEKFGIYQPVGDTAGPGGVLRAMRTVPIFEGFARAIQAVCPNAWVINLTNPMSICVKAMTSVFPGIKVFGCCHEVFHAQEFLCCVVKEMLNLPRPARQEIQVDVCGVNHFTWITRAHYQGMDLFPYLPAFIDRFYDRGYCERPGCAPDAYLSDDPFIYGNKVKMDLFRRYGALGAAGDRHLVEFLDGNRYLGSADACREWLFHLTPVSWRLKDRERKIRETAAMADGSQPVKLHASDEELIAFIKALCGMGSMVSNANTVNQGQMPQLPLGSIVETNHYFSADSLQPIVAAPLPAAAAALVQRCNANTETLYEGIRRRDLTLIFASFMGQALCSGLTYAQGEQLFGEMALATREALDPYYDLSPLESK